MANLIKLKFNAHGFWIPPAFIEVLSEYICEIFENIGVSNFSENLQNIYDDCDSNRKGESIGMVDILFDLYIINEADKSALIDVLNKTKTLILSKGTLLSIQTLDAFESRKTDDYFKRPWSFPIKTESLLATIDIIIQMLNGTWSSDNYSVYFAGFPNPRNFPEI